MTAAALGYTGNIAIVKYLSAEIDIYVLLFWRYFLALLFFAPWLLRAGRASLATTRLGLHIGRAVLMVVHTGTLLVAILLIPLAEATSLIFTTPLFAALVAALVLGDLHDPDAFAIMAVGDSLRPAGIWPGFLCLCSPRDHYDKGDVVFVERSDGTASLKLFDREDADWIDLAGYLPPDEHGHQMPYTERLARDYVRRIATVVYVKRKL